MSNPNQLCKLGYMKKDVGHNGAGRVIYILEAE